MKKRSVYFTVNEVQCKSSYGEGLRYSDSLIGHFRSTGRSNSVPLPSRDRRHRGDRWKHLNSHWLGETGEIKKKRAASSVVS